jgi:tetratricopeptide (TPR) repeat protein
VGEAMPVEEESLADIVDGFKKGVAEVLSPEAYDTHYNLGIAYREMGLVDEAIGEFQLSAKAPELLVDSCSMLGACFLEKGFPDLAVKWYKRGLEEPGLDEEESLSLLYDLGSVYATSGEREAAYEVFVEIYGVNSHYRDVVARLEELRGD